MASKNSVVLTFAGDSSKLEQTFDDVGASAKTMAGKVDSASSDIESSFGRAGGGIDNTGQKAGDLESGFRGLTDSASGFAQIAKGDVMGGLTDLAGGAEALATGFSGVVVPALQKTVGWLAQTRLGMAAMALWSGIVSAATKVWAGVQAVFNAVMALNPVTIIIIAIIALVAVIVLIATKTQFFQELWHRVWSVIGDPVKAVWEWLSGTLWPGIQKVWDGILTGVRVLWEGVKRYFGFWRGLLSTVVGWVTGVWDSARRIFNNLVDFVKGLPGRIGRAARGMFGGIRDAFRGAINWVIDRWNGLSFRLPSVTLPFIGTIGGATLSTPNIPRLHQGGMMPGAPGTEGLALLQAGERVTPAGQGGRTVLEVRSGGSPLDDLLVEVLARAVRVRGGDVQVVLGG